MNVTSDLKRKHRVGILDCDSLRCMANFRYFYYMDFNWVEKLFRSSLFENTAKKGMYGVLGSQKIFYKKPLKRWSTFTITLVLEAWDDKWFCHKQIFTGNQHVCAIGYTRAALWKNKNVEDMRLSLTGSGVAESERNVPPKITNLFENDYQILERELKPV